MLMRGALLFFHLLHPLLLSCLFLRLYPLLSFVSSFSSSFPLLLSHLFNLSPFSCFPLCYFLSTSPFSTPGPFYAPSLSSLMSSYTSLSNICFSSSPFNFSFHLLLSSSSFSSYYSLNFLSLFALPSVFRSSFLHLQSSFPILSFSTPLTLSSIFYNLFFFHLVYLIILSDII